MNLKYFDLAKKIATLSDHRNFKLGAVIVRGSKIISVGTNKLKTHPKSPHPYSSLHSEMAAVISAKQNLQGCEIYVYRETKAGVPALARPCMYCFPFIKEAGIKQVHFSINNGYQTENLYNKTR